MLRIKNSISREDAEKKLITALAEMIMDIRETCDSDIESTLEYMSGMVPSISIGETFNIVRENE